MTMPIFSMLNTPEIIALLVLALVLFGAKKLPELAKGLGQGIKEFRKASREVSNELQTAMDSEPPPPPPPPAPLPQASETVPQTAEISPPIPAEPVQPSPSEPSKA